MDIVSISELRVDTVIGVHDWERRIRQTVIINLELGTDCSAAAASDDLADALDYAAVSDAVSRLVRNAAHQLVETLAEQVAAHVMETFAVPWLRLQVLKPGAVPGARHVGVTIERGQRG